jgi:transposase-like protein
METNTLKGFRRISMKTISLKPNSITRQNICMGSRVCANCGKTKDTSGGKTCSHGHFICHSCASGHVHCPLCGHTLR